MSTEKIGIQEDLPEDFPTPNGNDDQTTPVVSTPGQPYEDSTGVLPEGTEKYNVTSNQWLAIPLQAGIYNIRGREQGQSIYIAPSNDPNVSLRVTKAFNIELPSRTVLYVKGQSFLDQIINNIKQDLAGKADRDTTYTKTETDLKIQTELENSLSGLTDVMQFKGTVESQNSLPTENVINGDVYQATDTGKFYVAKVDPEDRTISWQELSGSFVDLEQYYTKPEINLLIEGKADKTTMDRYKGLVENFIPTFTWQQNNDPSEDNRPEPIETENKTSLDGIDKEPLSIGTIYKTKEDNKYYQLQSSIYITVPNLTENKENLPLNKVERYNNSFYQLKEVNGQRQWEEIQELPKVWAEIEYDPNWIDPTKEGDTWLQNNTGIIFIRKRSELDQSLFWANAIESALIIKGANYVTTNTTQNITSEKTFTVLPKTDTNIVPDQETQFVTKKYVDDAITTSGGGTPIIPANVARLDIEQVFNAQNTFSQAPLVIDINEELQDNQLATKSKVEAIVNSKFETNPTITNPSTFDNLQDNQLITKGILQGIGAGGGIDTANLAKLHSPNIFTAENTFTQPLNLQADPVSGNDAVRMSFMETKIQEGITTNNTNYYDSDAIDRKLQEYAKKDSLVNFLEFKGSLSNYGELQNLTTKQVGDTYYVENPENKKGFWCYDGTSFRSIGTGININDVDYAKLSVNNTNTFNSNNIFNLSFTYDNGTEQQLQFQVGDWINATKTGLNFNNLYLFNNNKAQFKSNVFEIENIATFDQTTIQLNVNPTITNPKVELTDNDLITKKYLTEELANYTPGTGEPSFNLAEDHTFTGDNTFTGGTSFSGAITITNNLSCNGEARFSNLIMEKTVDNIDNLQDDEVPNKKLIVDKIDTIRIISEEEPSEQEYPVGTLWIKTSYSQDENDKNLFTDIPGFYISVGGGKWWDLHRESLL